MLNKIYPDASVIYAGEFGIGKGLPTFAEFQEMEEARWIWSKQLRTACGVTYRLYNYQKTTAYERMWNEVTLNARGLIVCEETGEVVAASLPKFFNLGETIVAGLVSTVKDGPFEAFVKEDGSLGIGYRLDGKYRWATRGSFDSTQSAVAQRLWDAKYASHDALLCGEFNHLTLMAEIISPDTRQVVVYPFEDLVLIAARNRFTGADIAYGELALIGERLGMRVVERLDSSDLDALLYRAEQLDGNHEGFVLKFADGSRAKVKGEEYKRLHRILSGINAKTLAVGWFDGTIDELLKLMPEEFREETEALVRELDVKTIESVRRFEELYASSRQLKDKKAFVDWALKQGEVKDALFARRKFDEQGGVSVLARIALATMIANERLKSQLELEADSALLAALMAYEEMAASYLWDNTRSADLRAKARKMAQSLPQPLRGPFDSVLISLQQDAVVDKARDFARRSAEVAELVGVDVDAIFADAPDAESPMTLHKEWVFKNPLALRGFLDQWRICGKRGTATMGARKLLIAALRSGNLAPYLEAVEKTVRMPHGDVVALLAGLDRLAAQLQHDWLSLPHGDGPRAVAEAVEAMGVRSEWGRWLLREAWSAERAKVRDAYIASDPESASLIADDE